jgi:hypothetical protein
LYYEAVFFRRAKVNDYQETLLLSWWYKRKINLGG